MSSDAYPVPEGAQAPFEPATNEEIDEIERKLGVRLPEDYRQFLLTARGLESGYPILVVSTYDPVGKREHLTDLGVLWTASKKVEEHCHILNRQKDFGFGRFAPERMLVIGKSFGEDQFCISLSGADRGHVYHWYHFITDPDEVPQKTEDDLTHLAKSFREFWQRIRVARTEEL